MPERNSSGRIAAFTTGGAASAFGIAAVSASASAANDEGADEERHDELEERAAGRDRRVVDDLPEERA